MLHHKPHKLYVCLSVLGLVIKHVPDDNSIRCDVVTICDNIHKMMLALQVFCQTTFNQRIFYALQQALLKIIASYLKHNLWICARSMDLATS